MNVENMIHILAGVLILGGLILSIFASLWWLLIPTIVGLNLLIDGLTSFCMARIIIKKFMK